MSDNTAGEEALAVELGMTEEGYLPDEQAPPIEWENLRALAAGSASADDFYRLTRLTAQFRSWSAAMAKVLGEASPRDAGTPGGNTASRTESEAEVERKPGEPGDSRLAELRDEASEMARHGRYEEAVALGRDAYDLTRRRLGDNAPATVAALRQLVGWHESARTAAAEQAQWEAYVSWLFGMVRVLTAQEAEGPEAQALLVELLDEFRRQARQGRCPRFLDPNDLWRCLIDLAHLDFPGREAGAERPEAQSGTVQAAAGETVRDRRVEQYPDTLAFAEQVAAHCRRCIGLLADWDADLRDLALGKLRGWTDEELSEKLGRGSHLIAPGLRLIRKRWAPLAQAEPEAVS
jgi:hypothetical protein